jgi:hypothetical protein
LGRATRVRYNGVLFQCNVAFGRKLDGSAEPHVRRE